MTATTTTPELTLYQWAGDLIVHRSPECVRELLGQRGYTDEDIARWPIEAYGDDEPVTLVVNSDAYDPQPENGYGDAGCPGTETRTAREWCEEGEGTVFPEWCD